MNVTINRRVFLSAMLQFFLLVLFILVGMECWHSSSSKTEYFLSLAGTVVFVSLLGLWKFSTGRIFTPYILFLLSFFLFQFGQCFLRVFNVNTYLLVFNQFPASVLVRGTILTVVSMQLFHLGATSSILLDKQHSTLKYSDVRYHSTLSTLKVFGVALLVLLTPVNLYFTLKEVILSLKYGYMNLYNYAGSSNFAVANSSYFQLISALFLVAWVMVIIAYKDHVQKANRLILLALSFGLLDLLSGSRVTFISLFLTLMCMKTILIEKMSLKSALRILAVFILLSLVIPFVAYFRLHSNSGVSGLYGSFSYMVNSNPLVTTINELGGSMAPLLDVVQIIPNDVSFKWGQSYIAAACTLVPNVFHILGPVHPAAKDAHVAEWLLNYLHTDIGPGFSMVAEGYYNFGIAGVLVLFGWGYIIGKLLECRNVDTLRKSPLQSFVVFASLLLLFPLPRNESADFFRNVGYYVLAISFLMKVYEVSSRGRFLRKFQSALTNDESQSFSRH